MRTNRPMATGERRRNRLRGVGAAATSSAIFDSSHPRRMPRRETSRSCRLVAPGTSQLPCHGFKLCTACWASCCPFMTGRGRGVDALRQSRVGVRIRQHLRRARAGRRGHACLLPHRPRLPEHCETHLIRNRSTQSDASSCTAAPDAAPVLGRIRH
jgi:hypothetical protein